MFLNAERVYANTKPLKCCAVRERWPLRTARCGVYGTARPQRTTRAYGWDSIRIKHFPTKWIPVRRRYAAKQGLRELCDCSVIVKCSRASYDGAVPASSEDARSSSSRIRTSLEVRSAGRQNAALRPHSGHAPPNRKPRPSGTGTVAAPLKPGHDAVYGHVTMRI
jgi:hypothetical protein